MSDSDCRPASCHRILITAFAMFVAACAMTGIVASADDEQADADNANPLEAVCGVPFADNAVFQQGMRLPIWGQTRPGAQVQVTFASQAKTTAARADGTWRVTLDPLQATKLASVNDVPRGHTLRIVTTLGGERAVKELTNIAIGDVWVCAGQSNMAGRMKRAGHPKNFPPNSVNNANYPALRFLNAQDDAWSVCTPETVVDCSRVAFFFARRLQQDALVPIGLINRAVGGSNIESWLNQPPYPIGKNYSQLVKPVVGYGIRGVVWYQGESNEKDGRAYQPKLESLITGWRKAWGQGDFPVHYVQLPGIRQSTRDNPAGGDGRAEIRQAYVETLALKNTGLAVTIDVGAAREHPPNKYDTGVRLARSVLQKVYGLKNLTACPLYKDHVIEGNAVRIRFTDVPNGLMVAVKQGFDPPRPTPGAIVKWLAIQAKDGSWHWANGRIDGSELIVTSDEVDHPVAVRYAYTTHPDGPLLYNKDGMPVGPFTTCGYDEHAADQDQDTAANGG